MIAALIASIAANAVLVFVLTRHMREESAANRRQTATLLQRIQAPDAAVQQHALETQPIETPRPVSLFDDTDYWDARPQMTKDELAEAAMNAELAHA